MLNGSEHELRQIVYALVQRALGISNEIEEFSQEASNWIITHLGLGYSWPGNVRELEQCLRNLLIRGNYIPPKALSDSPNHSELDSFLETTPLTADELIHKFIAATYKREGNLAKTAMATRLDRRTVKKYLES